MFSEGSPPGIPLNLGPKRGHSSLAPTAVLSRRRNDAEKDPFTQSVLTSQQRNMAPARTPLPSRSGAQVRHSLGRAGQVEQEHFFLTETPDKLKMPEDLEEAPRERETENSFGLKLQFRPSNKSASQQDELLMGLFGGGS